MINLGVIFGGKSTENEISCISAKGIIKNLDKNKYNIFPIYIDKNGNWFEDNNSNKIKIENIIEYVKKLDLVFPVLHGLYGEDGTIQGMFELFGIKYVGCGVLASAVGMDKAYTKIIFEKANLNQTKYVYLKKFKEEEYIFINDDLTEVKLSIEDIVSKIEAKQKYPMFVKPSNSGSSVGINKAKNSNELKEYIKFASNYDTKILVEEGIDGKEVECAVLGNSQKGVITTNPGQILPSGDFYSYDSKYNDNNSKTLLVADITEEQKEEIKQMAEKAFLAIDGNGLSRVDFFVENSTGKVFINEINTMPGFTEISMYPKLFEAYGVSYSELLDKLIELEVN